MQVQPVGPAIGAAGPVDMVVDPALADAATRRRLSGPALRTFVAIAERWHLGEAERLRILGQPGRSTYYAWLDKARRGEAVALPLDLVTSGTQDGLMLVRRHLDAWRGGNFSAPSSDAGPPLRDDDIVIVDDRRPPA